MKYILEIIQIDKRPEEWTSKSAWPGIGLYQVKDDSSLYSIHKHGVEYIAWGDCFFSQPYEDIGGGVSESLFLKAIAAASQAKILK